MTFNITIPVTDKHIRAAARVLMEKTPEGDGYLGNNSDQDAADQLLFLLISRASFLYTESARPQVIDALTERAYREYHRSNRHGQTRPKRPNRQTQ